MKQFAYTIRDPRGIHARPAGLLAREAKKYAALCTVTKDGVTVRAGQLMKLMSLGVKQGDIVIVAAEGDDEDSAIAGLRAFFEAHL